jgi:phosphatidylglycerophosphatase A
MKSTNFKKEARLRLLRSPDGFLALGGGAGLAPKAPGTVGTLAAIPLLWPLSMLSLPILIGGLTALFLLGVLISDRVSKRTGVSDPSFVVWDEMVGLWVVFIALPLTWLTLPLGFLLFRLFDIFKPWPVSWSDRAVKGGLGIMLDDLIAALYATLALRVILLALAHFAN